MTRALHYLTIEEAAPLLRDRKLSPVELVRAHLARIDAIDSMLHAFITVTAGQALEEAKAAEREIGAGRYGGPLHGIPIAHKDLVWTRGVRTTAHSRSLCDFVPGENATVYERLRAAGAISLGKTSLHEFGIGSPGADEAFPAARNAWNPAHMPGSSSSGSGTGLAAGLFMGATGTDTGGSIRHPAAVCGIVGMKPTYGRVSCHGVMPLSRSLDHVGPMTRTVRDNAMLLQAMAGHDPRDPGSSDAPVPDFSRRVGAAVQGLRLGVPRKFIATIEHTPEVLAAFEDACRVFRDQGAELSDVDAPGLGEAHDIGTFIMLYEGYQVHGRTLRETPDRLGVNLRERFAAAPAMTREQYLRALERAAELRAAVRALFTDNVDALIHPARERPAQPMTELIADPLGKRSVTLRLYNVTGGPALVLPMGFGAAGLPLGLQIAADHFREDVVYQVAHAYEQATRWCDRHPSL